MAHSCAAPTFPHPYCATLTYSDSRSHILIPPPPLLPCLPLVPREGKPTIMPDGPPKEEMGEGSEGWSDFYGSVRPRHVESEDVRNALWATDEFESDEVGGCVWILV